MEDGDKNEGEEVKAIHKPQFIKLACFHKIPQPFHAKLYLAGLLSGKLAHIFLVCNRCVHMYVLVSTFHEHVYSFLNMTALNQNKCSLQEAGEPSSSNLTY